MLLYRMLIVRSSKNLVFKWQLSTANKCEAQRALRIYLGDVLHMMLALRGSKNLIFEWQLPTVNICEARRTALFQLSVE